jgi:branched-chain amino acid transport system substrate-binding protein
MTRLKRRPWKLVVPLVAIAVTAGAVFTSSLATSAPKVIKLAIMTDCQGAFGGSNESTIGGALSALAQFAGGKPTDPTKPSAGMTGISVAGHPIQIVGFGCGNDTVALADSEIKRLMEQLNADIMIGPLSGDEAIAVAHYAQAHPTKTFIIGTAGSQDPTLQIAPKNLFRYHADGAQWNAGAGQVAYLKLHWRRADIIMDDYSFGWTSGAGLIADFCGIGGKIVKRVFPPLNTTDYAPYIQQLDPPSKVDGYFWVVGGTGTGPSLKAFEAAYGALSAKKFVGNLFFFFESGFADVAPRLVGAYFGGFGNAPGLKDAQAKAYEATVRKWYGKAAFATAGAGVSDSFVYNYFNAAHALVIGLKKSGGALGATLQADMPQALRTGYQVSNGGLVKLDSNRQAITDQYVQQIVLGPDGKPSTSLVGYVPGVDQSFGGFFKKTSPPPGRAQPPCVKHKFPWQGKIQVVSNGTITKQIIK